MNKLYYIVFLFSCFFVIKHHFPAFIPLKWQRLYLVICDCYIYKICRVYYFAFHCLDNDKIYSTTLSRNVWPSGKQIFFLKKSMHIECLALHICLPFRLKKRNNNLCKKLSIFLKNGVASTIFSNSQPFVEKLSRNSLLCKQYRCLVFNSLFLKTCYSWFEKDSLRNCHWFSKMYSYKTRGWVKKFPRSIFIQLAERQEKIK